MHRKGGAYQDEKSTDFSRVTRRNGSISGLVVIYLLPDKPSKLPVVIDEQWSEHVGEEGKISKFKISVPNEVSTDILFSLWKIFARCLM